jgi:hypothetical protein
MINHPNHDPIFDKSIESVSKTTRDYIVEHYGLSLLVVGLVLIMFWAAWYWQIPQLLFFGLGTLLAFYSYVQRKVEHIFMQQFAQANSYEYQQTGSQENRLGYIFKLGHSTKLEDQISWMYKNCPINLFNYTYTVGSGKDSHTYRQTIFEIDFQTPVPHIALKHHMFGDIFGVQGATERIKLEGDFDKYFDVFAEKGFEIETLEIFTPDLMEKAENEWKQFTTEFVGTKLYIYSDAEIQTKIALESMYQVALYLAGRLDPILDKMKSDMAAMQAVAH